MSTINDFGIPGVGTGILQPKQKNRWRVTFSNLGGSSSSQPVSMQAVTVGRPTLEFEEKDLHRYNSKAWIAGKYSFNPIDLVVEDDVTGSASQVIQNQLQQQQWLIGAEGQWLAAAAEGSLYKFVMYIEMLDGNDQVIEQWIVEGAWLQSVKYDDLDYASGDPVRISMTIRYDFAHQTIGPYGDGPGIATGGVGKPVT